MTALRILHRLAAADDGTMAIETAFIAPILAIMCLGGFEASRIVSRNTELRTALAEAGSIAVASPPDSQARIDAVEDIVEASTGSDDSEVTVAQKFRCNNDATFVDSKGSCTVNAVISTYLQITITDTYTPAWTSFGIGSPVSLSVTKTVQTS
ncbi:TadE/TadG family type IV pilus assembly protein [Parerythrobacter aurantius]|uniref:TadE/TadG family type IV pilus assembly protein n=1 Tax=Parerythrobacter aurantius TaxID=3127706 RepID=UPI003250D5FE